MPSKLRSSSLLCCLLTVIGFEIPASALERSAPPTRLAVLPFVGKPKADLPHAEAATRAALAARKDLSLLSQKRVASGLHGAALSTASADGLRQSARLLGVELLVTGHLSQHRLVLALCDGATGKTLATAVYDERGRKFPGLADGLLAHWSVPLDRVRHPVPTPVAVAPPVPAPAPAPQPPPAPIAAVEASPAKAEPPLPGPLFIELALGGGVLGRSLRYRQDLFGTLGSYQLNGTPVFGGTLAVYPLAPLSHGPLAYVGLVGGWARTAGFSTSLYGQPVDASSDRLAGGLRLRVPIGPSEVGVTGEYGRQYFRFGTLPGQSSPIPNYDYDFLLAALDARVVLGSFALLLGGGYLGVLQNGLASSGYFPHSQVAGVEANLGPAYLFNDVVELRLTGDYQRYFFSMDSRPGDLHVAGGATDQYLSIVLALAVRIQS